MEINNNKLLDTEEIARRIGCSLRVAREIVLREMPFIRIGRNQVTGKIRVEESDFLAWICGKKVSK